MNRSTITILLSFITTILFSQDKVFTTQKVSEPIRIDGVLDDAWNAVEWDGGDFHQRTPYDGQIATEQTKFKILYDNDFIYVYVKALDSAPDSIVRRLSQRDTYQGDRVDVYFDSYHDKRTAFCFTASASGVKSDQMVTADGDRTDSSWNPIWYLATAIEKDGWVAEMKIPVSQLRFSKSENLTWGFQIRRSIFRKGENSFWKHFDRKASGWVSHFGELTGIINLQPKRQNEIAPYVVGGIKTYDKESGNVYRDGTDPKFNIGLDGRLGLTNNFTLDYSINPDFGQVEADASEVNLSAFESYFPEKRPFFVAGKETTNFNLGFGDGDMSQENLFYSRRIGKGPSFYPDEASDTAYVLQPENTRILGALKVSGKTQNGWTVGLMETVTQSEYAKINYQGTEWKEKVEPYTNYFVSRAQKDFNEGSTVVGGMFTATNRKIDTENLKFLHKEAYTGGVDLNHRWADNKYMLDFKFTMSHVAGDSTAITRTQRSWNHRFQRPDADHLKLDSSLTNLTGFSSTVVLGKLNNSGLRYAGWITMKSPGFEINDVGYYRGADDVTQIFWMGYNISKPTKVFKYLSLNASQWQSRDFALNYNGFGLNTNGWGQFNNYWSVWAGYNYNFEGRSTSYLRGGPSFWTPASNNYWIGFETDERKAWIFSANYSAGNSINNSFHRNNYNLNFSYRPIDALKLSLSPSISERIDKLQYVTEVEYGDEIRYILGKIDQKTLRLEFRVDLSLTPTLSIQYFGQPFISFGEYSDFKYVTDPDATNFADRFANFSPNQISFSSKNDEYSIDENNDGVTDYNIGNPNFDVKVLLSNFVIRWEYKPGSALYFVWSQTRDPNDNYTPAYNYDMGKIFKLPPTDIFMVKFSYRFSL